MQTWSSLILHCPPPFIFPELLRGTQAGDATILATVLALFPQLSASPCLPQSPITLCKYTCERVTFPQVDSNQSVQKHFKDNLENLA